MVHAGSGHLEGTHTASKNKHAEGNPAYSCSLRLSLNRIHLDLVILYPNKRHDREWTFHKCLSSEFPHDFWHNYVYNLGCGLPLEPSTEYLRVLCAMNYTCSNPGIILLATRYTLIILAIEPLNLY